MKKWVVIASAGLMLVLFWRTGVLEQLSDLEWVRLQVESSGVWGPLIFLALVTVLFPLFLAGPLIWLSMTMWRLPEAILLANIAALMPSLLLFVLARRLGKEWADRHVPEKIWAYEGRLSAYPIRTILTLRTFLWINPAVDILIGVSRIRTSTYVTYSALALIVSTTIQVFVITYGAKFLFGE